MTKTCVKRLLSVTALLFVACGVQAQTTNWWTNNVASSSWTVVNNWGPFYTNYPDSVGAVVYITNGITGDRILTINTNVTLGTLFWGDTPAGSQMDLRTNAAGARLTFDTGDDGQMAVISHSSGDTTGDIGNDSDDTDVGITVADAQGLYIDAYRQIFFTGRTFQNSIFDGGGHDIVKAEDGVVYFQRLVTNVNTIYVRDGSFRIDPEGNPATLPNINTVVVGVASGVIDRGEANQFNTVTNLNEGTSRDRRQFAQFELIGAASTNFAPVMTNDFNLVMNRGIFRSYNRLQWTNGAAPAVYSGNVQLNGSANEVFFQIESDSTTATSS